MWKTFFSFDLRYHLRQPLLWLSTLPLMLLAFASAGSDTARIGGSIGNAHLNAPVVIVNQMGVLSIMALFLVTFFVAGALLRDNEAGMADLLFATPMRKIDYLLGRFLAGFSTCLLVFALITLAMVLGSRMPGIDPARLGPFSLYTYAWAFLVYAVPNLLFVSALLMLLAATTRSMMMVYVGVLGFISLWGIAGFLGGRADSATLAVLLDPFGVRVLFQATRYFTAADTNAHLPALDGALLDWERTALSRLALVILLDQFTRNIHRGRARAFAGDPRAQRLVREALDAREDELLPLAGQIFLYLPLEHAEDQALQDESVRRFTALNAKATPACAESFARNLDFAHQHRDIIARFGRFPHRNAALGRASTPEEDAFLHDGRYYAKQHRQLLLDSPTS